MPTPDRRSTSPILPSRSCGWLALVILPLADLGAVFAARGSAELRPHPAVGVGLLVLLGALALSQTSAVREMPAGWRATWALVGGVVAAVISAVLGVVLAFGFLYVAYHQGGCFS